MHEKEPITRLIRLLRGGQITIPVEFRKKLGLGLDDRLKLILADGELRIKPVHTSETGQGSPWLKDLYDLFAPVREEAKDLSEQEIDTAIDQALSQVEQLESIRTAGFSEFVPLRELRANELRDVPDEMGVYLVLRLNLDPPTFLERSPAGRFKGKDPTVPTEELKEKWVPNAPVVYIGKAGGPTNGATLKSRLRQYLAFGAGQPVGHRGGRFIWQLANADFVVYPSQGGTDLLPVEDESDVALTASVGSTSATATNALALCSPCITWIK